MVRTAAAKLYRRMSTKSWILLLFVLPSFIFLLVFSYAPMYGLQIAFRDYKMKLGFWDSPWVGLDHFEAFFTSFRFSTLVENTLRLSLYYLICGFPFPIIMAIMFNYLRSNRMKRFAQTVSYAPYFISTVVVVGMLTMFMSPSSGFINTIREALGAERFNFFASKEAFPHLYVWSGIWQSAGWNAVIYISALSGVDPQLHEAAIIDGATIPQRIWHVDLPAILPTIIILLILQAGSIMNVGYEKVYLMQNPINLSVSEVISTYSYKVGLESTQYSYSTAIGLFNNVINFALVMLVNKICDKLSGTSMF